MESIDTTQILHAVKVMIQRYGNAAPDQAAMRAKELSDRGDEEGAEIWLQVEVQLLARLTEQYEERDSQR
jgi:hypothetical protein|tara:strand:+ start:577 stop:786 length:210 start_codon:yes stop_codon:yes gene_type:complete